MAMASAKHGRRIQLAVLLACGLALISGCGSDEGETSSAVPTIPALLSERLASESDDVAAALDAGDGCEAQEQAAELESAVAETQSQLPRELRGELQSGVAVLVSEIECVLAPEPKPEKKEQEEEEQQEDGEEGEDGRGPDSEGPPGQIKGDGEEDPG